MMNSGAALRWAFVAMRCRCGRHGMPAPVSDSDVTTRWYSAAAAAPFNNNTVRPNNSSVIWSSLPRHCCFRLPRVAWREPPPVPSLSAGCGRCNAQPQELLTFVVCNDIVDSPATRLLLLSVDGRSLTPPAP